MFLKG